MIAFTLAISVMSATMFNIALPEMMAEFDLSLSQVSWVTSSYLLIYAIGSMAYGKLADSYKLKHLLTFGLIVLALGSVIGFVAQAYWMVLLGRIVQAIGAAVIPATSTIIPVRLFPPESRGRALGIAMTGGAIGSALGPAVAGLMISVLHWRFLFCMPLFTLLALPFYRKYLMDEPGKGESIDWTGGVLLSGAVALLLLAITNGSLIAIAGCLAVLLLFVIRTRYTQVPFIQPKLFKSKKYTLGLIVAFFFTGIGYSLFFLTPQLLTDVNRLEPGLVGFVMMPAAIVTAFMGRRGGKLADRKGNTFLFTIASGFYVSCFTLLYAFAGNSPLYISMILILGNVGQSFMYIALSNSISQTLPRDQSGVGMGLLSMLNFISGAVFASTYGKLVDHGTTIDWTVIQISAEASVYNLIYFMLSVLIVVISSLYFVQIGKVKRKQYFN